MTMKKIIAFLLSLVMCIGLCFSLVACGPEENDDSKQEPPKNQSGKVSFDDAFALIIRDFTINVEDVVIELDVFELYISESDGEFIGGGSGKIKVSEDGESQSIDASIIVENGEAYAVMEAVVDGESQTVYFDLDFETLIGFALENSGVSLEDIDDFVNGEMESKGELVAEWLSEQLIPALGNIEAMGPSEEDMQAAIECIAALISNFISEDQVGSNVEISLDLEILKSWLNAFKTKTAAEFIDTVLGEGTYESIKASVAGILSYTIGDFITEFEKNGGSVQGVVDAIDAMLVIMDAPDGVKIDALIKEYYPEFDTAAEFIASEEISSLCLNDFLMMVLSDEENTVTPEVLQELINGIYADLESNTLPDYIGMSEDELSVLTENINVLCDSIELKLTVNADSGEFVSLEFGINVNGDNLTAPEVDFSVKITGIANGIKAQISAEVAGEEVMSGTAELISGADGYYNKTKLDKIKKNSAIVQNVFKGDDAIDNMVSMLELSYLVEEYEPISNAEGDVIGIIVTISNWGDVPDTRYTVYFEDLFAVMIIDYDGMCMANVIFMATGEDFYYESDTYTGEWVSIGTTTLEIPLFIDLVSGEIVNPQQAIPVE